MRFRKIIVLVMMLWAMCLSVNAQQNGHHGKRLSKEQFMAEMEKFVTAEAELTPQECKKLFPIMREMYSKQRAYFNKLKLQNKKRPQSEEDCRDAVIMRDKIDIDIKKIQQAYHNKMLRAISPCKVMRVIYAEDKFHREKLKNWGRKGKKK